MIFSTNEELSISPGSLLRRNDEKNIRGKCSFYFDLFVDGFLFFNSILLIIDDEQADSHRSHQSIEIKYHNEPGWDVRRCSMISD